jgi:anti-sigma regulatory factor (Ser/Thr protein kinase)
MSPDKAGQPFTDQAVTVLESRPRQDRTGASRPCPNPPRPAQARPSYAFLDLDAVISAPGCARAWIRATLREWGVARLAGDAEIVASELVTNSVNAYLGTDRPLIRLTLTLDQGELAILVCDDNPGVPVTAHPDAEEESGRGLLIVESLSDRSGWYPRTDGKPGKVVWATISG